jgi:hypothetical protein
MPQTGMIDPMKALVGHCETESGRRGVFQRIEALCLGPVVVICGHVHAESTRAGSALPFYGAMFRGNACALRTNVSHFKNTKAKIAFMCGVVGIWFSSSLAVEAAPTAVKRSFAVTAQVLLVDCTTHPVKMKACAPVFVTTDTPPTENVNTVMNTVRYY